MTSETATDDAGADVETFADVLAVSRGKLGHLLRAPMLNRRSLLLIAALSFVGWLATGIYQVEPDEKGIVLRFGRWVETAEPGLHYRYPYPIDTVLLPKVTKINQLQLGRSPSVNASQMLTGDENIVEADCVVFWRIKDAGQFLFSVADPEGTLRMSAESAVREVIGRNPIQAALSDKRQQIGEETLQLLQRRLDGYAAGIEVTQIQLQRIDPPAAVIDAFNDVQRARADQERSRNEAEAYRNDILPRARGEAIRLVQDAEAYKAQVVDLAEGETRSLLAFYATYKLAEEVSAWRLYLDSIDELLKKSGRVVIDSSGKSMSSVVPFLSLSDAARPPAPATSPTGAPR